MRYAKRAVRGNRILKQDRAKWIVAENACAPIVEKSLFNDLQSCLGGNIRQRAWSEASTYLLTGLVRCGECGRTLTGMTCKGANGQLHRYYRCPSRIQKGPSACKGLVYRAGELEEAIVGQIAGFDAETLKRELEEHRKRIAEQAAPRAARRAELQSAFDSYRDRERRLLELYETNAIDLGAFKERREQLESQRLAVAAELTGTDASAPQQGAENIDPEALVRDYRELQASFEDLPMSGKQRLLQEMAREITACSGGVVRIHLDLTAGVRSPAIPLDKYLEIRIAPKGE